MEHHVELRIAAQTHPSFPSWQTNVLVNSKLILVIKYWNLFVIWCLKFGISTAGSEPQNIEQGISNIEVITSSFCGFLFCCSIFSALIDLSSVLCPLIADPAWKDGPYFFGEVK
jgi:hypothetical protein